MNSAFCLGSLPENSFKLRLLSVLVIVFAQTPAVCDHVTMCTVVAASIADIRRDTTADIQYYGWFIGVTAFICHSSTLSHHSSNCVS